MSSFAIEDRFAGLVPGPAWSDDLTTEMSAALPIFGPYRVLSIGSALLANGGVTYHGRTLSRAVERRLTTIVGHKVVVDSHLSEQSTLRALEVESPRGGLSRCDALIFWLDQRSSKASAATVAHHAHRLVEDLWLSVVPGTTITVVLPPTSITGWSVDRATALAVELRTRVNQLTRMVELIDRHGNDNVVDNYDNWVDEIADTVAGGLLDPLEELKPS